MTGHISKGFRAVALLTIAFILPAGGCDHRSSTPEDATAASGEVLHTLVGKQVTIRGKFSLRGKPGPYVLLGNQQVVYLIPKGSFTWADPHSEMEGKLVAATGILSLYHSPNTEPSDPAFARAPDYFYFEAETVQLRLISR